MFKGLENLECLSTYSAVKRGLTPIGEPVIARSQFELTDEPIENLYIDPTTLPRDAVAYSKGNPVIEPGSHNGHHAYVPIQFFARS